jgi:hypothetical protein
VKRKSYKKIKKKEKGRNEVFKFGEDERLIGCKLDEANDNKYKIPRFIGVTWFKMKVRF